MEKGAVESMKAHEQLQIEMTIDYVKKMVPFCQEHAKAVSQIMKAYYDELLAAGFTKEEALQIVIHHGIHIGGRQN
jgi:rRNA processing protein Krr1/Pno1